MGLAAVLLMITTGRIAGISGIVSRILPPAGKSTGAKVSIAFILGILVVAPIYRLFSGTSPEIVVTDHPLILVVAGLLVGFGSVLGNGCTSGHGVCGISRLSVRSIVATIVFMLAAIVTVFVSRMLSGPGI